MKCDHLILIIWRSGLVHPMYWCSHSARGNKLRKRQKSRLHVSWRDIWLICRHRNCTTNITPILSVDQEGKSLKVQREKERTEIREENKIQLKEGQCRDEAQSKGKICEENLIGALTRTRNCNCLVPYMEFFWDKHHVWSLRHILIYIPVNPSFYLITKHGLEAGTPPVFLHVACLYYYTWNS